MVESWVGGGRPRRAKTITQRPALRHGRRPGCHGLWPRLWCVDEITRIFLPASPLLVGYSGASVGEIQQDIRIP